MTVFLPCSIPPVFATEGTRRPPRGMISVRNEPIPRHLTCVAARLLRERRDRLGETGSTETSSTGKRTRVNSPYPQTLRVWVIPHHRLMQGKPGKRQFSHRTSDRCWPARKKTVRSKMSDRYEKAGLGPDIRSGAISGAEAARRVQDPERSEASVSGPEAEAETGGKDR